jgi:peptidylprolyl isomerase
VKTNHLWLGRVLSALIVLFLLSACTASPTTETAQATTPPAEPTQLAQAPTATTQSALTVLTGTETPVEVEPYILEGAQTTSTGLQFLELVAGTGQAPVKGDIVTMNLIGSLPDGTEFANSAAEEGPIKAIIGRDQLLPGWEEGLGLMKAGGKARMVLTPEQAFGEQGFGIIPPNTQIILEIELLTIEKPPQPSKVPADKLTTTQSGLQFVDLLPGTGEQVRVNSIVSTHFTVWVQGEDESEFIYGTDGSDPFTFVVGRGTPFSPVGTKACLI